MPKASDKTRRRRGDLEDASQNSRSQGKTPRDRRSHQGDEEEDMDIEPSQPSTQASQASQGQKSSKLTKAEMDRKVSEMVRYLLFVDRKKYPIKRGDITKNVMREHARAFNEVFELAKSQLKRVPNLLLEKDLCKGPRVLLSSLHGTRLGPRMLIFGIEVEEIEMGKTKAFILVDAIKDKQKNELIDWGDDLPKMGLLMVVLSLIFMSNGVMTESLLWHTLKKLGLEPRQEHKVFEDPEKLLSQEFTRQGYLDRKKLVASDGASFEYRWGPRASKELSKRQVLKFVAEMHGNSVEDWSAQMKEVLEEESGE